MHSFLLAATFAVLLAIPAAGQSLAELQPGARVRVTFRQSEQASRVQRRWTTGTVRGVDATELSLAVEGGGDQSELTIPVSALTQLQVSKGKVSSGQSALRGARRGGIVGAALAGGALLFGYALAGPTPDTDDSDCQGACEFLLPTRAHVVRNGAVGIIGGAGLGALFGLRSREQWVPARLGRFSLSTGGGAIQLSAAVN